MRRPLWPARASSAIPAPLPREAGDPVVASGKLWEAHRDSCYRCRYGRGMPDPRCNLGQRMHAVYETAANTERKERRR